MKIAVPTELRPDETRVALVPESVKKLCKAGISVAVQAGAGARSFFSDADFQAAGATLESDPAALLASADLVLKVQPPVRRTCCGRSRCCCARCCRRAIWTWCGG
jgi:H+-translocating NAD(P) transhydrogenase subunit alpha